ncbi:thiocillin family RiPP [Brevibacillus laterosporus]|nr:thiocillin family RiPP [Brevibacillus laterosporus]MDN9011990.1 thiocillin family RiPP [Brevibacillus laterosporus]MDO0943086.1 thiocillin family RiPP [Brevibacillus laterosporus]
MEITLELDLYAEELFNQTYATLNCVGTAGTVGTFGGCFDIVGTTECF